MASALSARPSRRLGPPAAFTLAALNAAGITVQVFLAGLNVFLGPQWWGLHIALGHGIGVLLLMQAVAAWLMRLPARSRWLSLGMLALFSLQYNVRALASLLQAPYLRALHAVNALLLFWIAITLAQWACQAVHAPQIDSSHLRRSHHGS
jgi:mercuric ion transport protein